MSALLAPEQPGLLGIDPAPQLDEVKFAITARLLRRAELRIVPSGQVGHLFVHIEQPSRSGHQRLPLVVLRTSTDIVALERLAERLVPGAAVIAIFRGLDFDIAHQELRAWRCDALEALTPERAAALLTDPQIAHHEARPT
jgi:hypothetical protein